MADLVCYCFGYTEDDIIRDMDEHGGESVIMNRIAAEKQQGTCDCAENHPEYR